MPRSVQPPDDAWVSDEDRNLYLNHAENIAGIVAAVASTGSAERPVRSRDYEIAIHAYFAAVGVPSDTE